MCNKLQLRGIAEELKDVYNDMIAYTHCDDEELSIDEAIQNNKEIREVIVIFHLSSGKEVVSRSRSYESFVKKKYCGDIIDCLAWDKIEKPIKEFDEDDEEQLEEDYLDSLSRRTLVNVTIYEGDITINNAIPLSAICYIEEKFIPLNLVNLSKYVK